MYITAQPYGRILQIKKRARGNYKNINHSKPEKAHFIKKINCTFELKWIVFFLNQNTIHPAS